MALCECGCGGETRIANRTDHSSGYVKGQPFRFLPGHYWKWKHGVGTAQWNGGRQLMPSGYVQIRRNGEPRIYEHVLVAEKALGRPLPQKAVVHHVNENRSENRNSNLVICENSSYHQLLHRRMNALKETGNVHSRKCQFCKKWGIDLSATINDVTYHDECNAKYRRERRMTKQGGFSWDGTSASAPAS